MNNKENPIKTFKKMKLQNNKVYDIEIYKPT